MQGLRRCKKTEMASLFHLCWNQMFLSGEAWNTALLIWRFSNMVEVTLWREVKEDKFNPQMRVRIHLNCLDWFARTPLGPPPLRGQTGASRCARLVSACPQLALWPQAARVASLDLFLSCKFCQIDSWSPRFLPTFSWECYGIHANLNARDGFVPGSLSSGSR